MIKQMNIAIIGFMGAGKSLISKLLAQLLNRKRISLDDLIEQKEGRAISDIFKDFGEPYFRKIESQIVEEISQQKNLIIDCGGGVVINPENIENLKKKGVLVYLSASPEIIYKRIKQETHRPLLQTDNPQEKIKELLNARQSFYQKADFTIDTDQKTPEEICQEIIRFLKQ
ncbi:MAG TPA: shikimate kinase [Candidatus Omnitrophota bacterium]|nr:shikimate kinase [Candidatus Omnitrophota bacterium]